MSARHVARAAEVTAITNTATTATTMVGTAVVRARVAVGAAWRRRRQPW